MVQGFLNDERGISSVEYALLLGFLGVGVVMGAEALSSAVEAFKSARTATDRNSASRPGDGFLPDRKFEPRTFAR